MKKLLYGTTALATAGLLVTLPVGCTQAPAEGASQEPAKAEEPIKLELGGYLHQSFSVGGASGSD